MEVSLIKKFTRELADLFVVGGFSLSESLKIISHKTGSGKNKIKLTAEYLFEQLEAGNLLSNGFKTCPYINFEESYVAFVAMSEKTGDLRKTLDYLSKKYERKAENRARLMEVSVYPVFVISLALGACIFLFKLQGKENFSELAKLISGLFFSSMFVFFMIGKFISEDKLFEAFWGIDFLLGSGVNLSSAVEAVVYIFGRQSKLGKRFIEAGEKIEYGMKLEEAFNLGNKFSDAFYYADRAGGKNRVFEKLALFLEEKSEKKRKLCLKLVEPLFTLITGIFVLILVVKFFMPFMNNLGSF